MSEPVVFQRSGRRELSPPDLAAGEVHLYSARLDLTAERVAAFERCLAPDEVERADRFRFARHRRRHVVSRGLLRHLLAAYTGSEPEQLSFAYGEKGKPSLRTGPGGSPLEFNVSHSGELVLIGVTSSEPLGVDVEELRPMPDAQSIARSFFSASERDSLSRVSPEQVSRAFFNCWTRKEAYIKAIGDGLSCPLDCFDVTLVPGAPARMLTLHGDPEKAADWSLHHLEPAPGYIGAVALIGHHWRLETRQLDLERLMLSRPIWTS